MPDVTVLMPVYNGCQNGKEDYLRKAIESILDQTYTNFEFVIVDDGSSDNTPSVLNHYQQLDARIKLFRNDSNQKIVKALNKGLSVSTAPLIARQDADDMSTVTRLAIQKDFLDNRPETALCGTGMYVINHEGKLEFESNHPCSSDQIRSGLKSGCMFVHGSVFFRKQAILDAGGYSEDPNVEYAEDYDLWVRVAAKNKMENIPHRSLYFHRNHGNKSSNVYRAKQEASTRNVVMKAQTLLA